MNWFMARARILFHATEDFDSGELGAVVVFLILVGVCVPMWVVYFSLKIATRYDNAFILATNFILVGIISPLLSVYISVFVGGVAKNFLARVSSTSVISTNLVSCVATGLAVALTVRGSINVLSTSSGLTGYAIMAFIIVWSAMSLNVLKAPWDELRDRISKADTSRWDGVISANTVASSIIQTAGSTEKV